jgi:hypothetical protein
MARVAMAHGINANLLRRWVVESTGQALKPVGDLTPDVSAANVAPSSIVARQDAAPMQVAFVPINVQAALRPDLRIEIERGDLHVKVTWPMDAGLDSAAWLRELLR